MTDDKALSPLAQKAIARREKREAERTAVERAAAEEQAEAKALADRWTRLARAYKTQIDELNKELEIAGTSLEAVWQDVSKDYLLGYSNVYVNFDDGDRRRSHLTYEIAKSGRGSVTEVVNLQQVEKYDVDFADINEKYFLETLREFVDRVLST